MLGEAGELRVWPCGGQDLCVASRDHPPTFAFERSRHYGGAAALGAALDDRVNKLNEFIGEADRDLFAHTIMVPLWDQRSEWSPPTHDVNTESARVPPVVRRKQRLATDHRRYRPVFRIQSRTAESGSPSVTAGRRRSGSLVGAQETADVRSKEHSDLTV